MSEFRFRRPGDDDIAVAARLVAAEERGVRGHSTWGVEETREWWSWASLADSWIVEYDGEPAAMGILMTPRVPERMICWVSVDPRFNARGLATELLRRGEGRARELAAPKLSVGRFAENDAAARLLDKLGFYEVRRFYQMRIDFDGPPEPVETPVRMRIVNFRREDARDFKATLDEAFAEEWGHVDMPYDEWRARRIDSPDADFSFWFIAREGDDIAGVLRGEANKHGGGYVAALGVRKAWRRRGVGLALLRHAFGEFQRRGLPHATLGVDTQNPTGATRLYERAGMYVEKEDVVYDKDLT